MKKEKILVSGGAGFIGSHLTRKLLEAGAEVSVIVKYRSVIDNIRLSSIWDDLAVYEADLRNIDSLRQFDQKSFDYIFHLAAYNHVGDSFLHINEALLSNAVATANFIEFGPECGTFLYMSTSEVYGYQSSVPFKENMNPEPISPYSIGKYAGELYARMKQSQTGKPIICVRAFNTFGPYQSDRAVIPELIIKCIRGECIETTRGIQTREFNYVANIVDALIAAAMVKPTLEGVINIGTNKEHRIVDLVKMVHELTNSKSELKIGALPDRPTEIWRMRADNSRIKELLNWEPEIAFEEGLIKTIAWYRKYVDVYYSRSSSLNQL